MSDITKFPSSKSDFPLDEFGGIDDNSLQDDLAGLEEELEKVRKRKKRVKIALFVLVLILLATAGSIFVYMRFKTYTDYSVLTTTGRTDSLDSKYVKYCDSVLKFSRDGASYMNQKGEDIWNYTFEMQNPIVRINGEAIAIADKKGTKIYAFNKNGLESEITTSLPIGLIEVSQTGVVMVEGEDSDTSYIDFYDSQGTALAQSKFPFKVSGYPLDIAISADGLKAAVSFLLANEGKTNTLLAFYNFDSIGQTKMDNQVNAQVYENLIVPELDFVDSATALAVGDSRIAVFQGNKIPTLKKEIELEEEIISEFHSNKHVGTVIRNSEGEDAYRMKLYDLDGKEILNETFDLEYTEIQIWNDQILIYNSDACIIYTLDGIRRFEGEFSTSIYGIVPVSGMHRYMLMTEKSVDQIRLK